MPDKERAIDTYQPEDDLCRNPGRSTAAPWAAWLLLVAWTLLLGACLGPPEVESREAYADPAGQAASFDHSAFDQVLRTHVDAEGWVDYQALLADPEPLESYLEELAAAPFDKLSRDGKLTLLINAYNAATLKLILDHMPLDSIKDIPADERWRGRTFTVGGNEWSLDQIEHEQLRPNFREPRIHFAVNCASIGCPPLRPEAYREEQIEEQLEEQTLSVHSRDRWFRWDGPGEPVRVTKIYDWYGGDFEEAAGSVLGYVAGYVPELEQALDEGREPRLDWLDYDWTLNDIRNRPQ